MYSPAVLAREDGRESRRHPRLGQHLGDGVKQPRVVGSSRVGVSGGLVVVHLVQHHVRDLGGGLTVTGLGARLGEPSG